MLPNVEIQQASIPDGQNSPAMATELGSNVNQPRDPTRFLTEMSHPFSL